MNKLNALLLISCLVFSLFAQHGNNDFDKFMEYQQDPTLKNFVSAIQHYDSLKSDDNGYLNYILVANLLQAEFESNVDFLTANLDSLSLGEKFQFANLLLAAGRYKQCIEIYNDLNTSSPKWSCPWRHKGQALLESENYVDAELATLKAIETREDHFDAYVQLATIQKNLGEYEKALHTLENGLQYQATDIEGEIDNEEVIQLQKELKQLIDK